MRQRLFQKNFPVKLFSNLMEYEEAWKRLQEITCEFVKGHLVFLPLNDSTWELVSYHTLRPKIKESNNTASNNFCAVEDEQVVGETENSTTFSVPMELEKDHSSSDKLMSELTISPTSPMGFALLQCSETENICSLYRKEIIGEFYSVDDLLTYEPFCADFGPLNLGQL